MEDLKRLGCAGFLTEFEIGGISDMFYEVLDEADLNLQVCAGDAWGTGAVSGVSKCVCLYMCVCAIYAIYVTLSECAI